MGLGFSYSHIMKRESEVGCLQLSLTHGLIKAGAVITKKAERVYRLMA